MKIGEFVQVSLRTKEAVTARKRHAVADAALKVYWEAQKKGPVALSRKDVVALAGLVYRAFADTLEDNPGEPGIWQGAVANNALASVGKFSPGARFGIFQTEADRIAYDLDKRFGPLADAVLLREGIVADAESRRRLIEETGKAINDASLKLWRNAKGDYAPDLAAARFPQWQPRDQVPTANLTLIALFERWVQHPENETVARRTKDTYRSVFRAVSAFLDNPDAGQLSAVDLNRYFDARMSASDRSRLSPRVARDVHKAAIASVYTWAVGKRIVTTNPASEIHIKVKKPPVVRSKAATDAETQVLADAAVAVPRDAAAQSVPASLRWCTLLLMYTGSRIGEVAQLRRGDVINRGGDYPMIRLTPEAGNVKDREFRQVPVHPRLIELGFLDFVRDAPEGPLFFRPGVRRRKDAATPQSDMVAARVATFARENGIGDPRIKLPLHALRHRFMTLARRAGVEEQYAEAIAGHSPGKQNREYGDYPPDVLHREIRRLDPQVVEGRVGPTSA